MHELSLAMEICRIVERTVGVDQLSRVTSLGVAVGDQANVEVTSLRFCLESLVARPPFGRARVEVVRSGDDALRLEYLEIDE
ncbi:MAG TPA: hydrogenase/urease maturation nickel metallochaperone HypA [Gemmatimonadaceae bacterium]|nr:hydrogenase/urease maturation nickel metallochaperone HypA [Gemmatimonadaceae bacterium]